MNSAAGLFGCKVALSYGGEVMLYGGEHVLLELAMLLMQYCRYFSPGSPGLEHDHRSVFVGRP